MIAIFSFAKEPYLKKSALRQMCDRLTHLVDCCETESKQNERKICNSFIALFSIS